MTKEQMFRQDSRKRNFDKMPKPTFFPTSTPTPTRVLVWPKDKPQPAKRSWRETVNPYLSAGGQATFGKVMICAVNDGDAPSYSTIVELYVVPDRVPVDLQAKLKDCVLLKRWSGLVIPAAGRVDFYFTSETFPALFKKKIIIVVVVYDPLLDPRGFRMNSSAPLRTVFRSGCDRDRHIFVISLDGVRALDA